jgi:hypothetical protein
MTVTLADIARNDIAIEGIVWDKPSIAGFGPGDALPNYSVILNELHTDLDSITTGLAVYVRDYGVPREPRRR